MERRLFAGKLLSLMEPQSQDIFYQAILDKNVYFEGPLITAVIMTGIFCRPTCTTRKPKPFIQFIFFGNYFYGICAVALSVEASLQQRLPLNDAVCYILIFLCTVLYYTVAYTSEPHVKTGNARLKWYARHSAIIVLTQRWYTAVVVGLAGYFFWQYWSHLDVLDRKDWFLIGVFPVVGAFYYGIGSGAFGQYNLRRIGWLKPFIIGFSWAGMVNVYPALYYTVQHQVPYVISLVGGLLFIKNFMFISVLCIIFDIKDYADDANQRLKTFVTEVGLRKTIFYILIPLSLLGLGSFLLYGTIHGFSWEKLLLNSIPFALLLAVTYSMHRRQSIMYYLMIIDGLLLVKAVCGTAAMIWF